MSEPTMAEVRDLAERWAAMRESLDGQLVTLFALTHDEVGSLLAWVRRRMELAAMPRAFAQHVAASGLHGEREVLAYAVGLGLGGAFRPGTGGWHRLALELCEAAGWPS
jgi:hypothetical protein